MRLIYVDPNGIYITYLRSIFKKSRLGNYSSMRVTNFSISNSGIVLVVPVGVPT